MLAVEWSQGIEDAWSDVASFVPKFLGFLVILLVGYFIVKAIAKVVDAALERVGFDRMVERGGVARAMERTKYDASDILAKVVFWTLMLIVLQMAFGVFGTNPVSDMIDGVVAYLPKVVAAIIIVVVAAAIAAAVREIVQASLGGLSYGPALANAASIAILVVAAFAALNQLQISPEIVNGLFYAMLAIVAGSAIIAIGGGGIAPMRKRWENVLSRYDAEKPNVQREMQGARERLDMRAQELKDKARTMASQSQSQSYAPPPSTVSRDPAVMRTGTTPAGSGTASRSTTPPDSSFAATPRPDTAPDYGYGRQGEDDTY